MTLKVCFASFFLKSRTVDKSLVFLCLYPFSTLYYFILIENHILLCTNLRAYAVGLLFLFVGRGNSEFEIRSVVIYAEVMCGLHNSCVECTSGSGGLFIYTLNLLFIRWTRRF